MYLCAMYKLWKCTVHSKLQEIYLLEELVQKSIKKYICIYTPQPVTFSTRSTHKVKKVLRKTQFCDAKRKKKENKISRV